MLGPVPWGIEVVATDASGGGTQSKTFTTFPVRMGRNPLNEFQLEFPFISDFHASIERHGDRLMLRDLGSTNGTMLRGSGRMGSNQIVDLAEHSYEFAIVSLVFRVRWTEVAAPTAGGSGAYAAVVSAAAPQAAGPAAAQHQQAYESYRRAWVELLQGITSSVNAYPADQRVTVLQVLSRDLPALMQEPDFQKLAASLGSPIPQAPHPTSRPEQVALQRVKELAIELVPGRGAPESPEELALFLVKLRAVLKVFLKTFVPLRDGYQKFKSDMDLRGAMQVTSESQLVSKAANTDELARGLLDWRSPVDDAPRAIESTLADLMTHHVAMLNGVMQGVKSLLAELSPSTITQMLDSGKKSEGIQMGPFRFKALWKAYEQRYADLTDEEKHVFSLLFGPAFASAYSRFRSQMNTTAMAAQPEDQR